MSIRRRKSQVERTNPLSNKKRLDERIKQHVKKFRIPLNNDNNNNNKNTSTNINSNANTNSTNSTNNTPIQIARDLTPTPPPNEQLDYLDLGFLSDLFPDNAFVDQAAPGMTVPNQIVPGSLPPSQSMQDLLNSMAGIDFPSTGQAVPNNNSSLNMIYDQNVNVTQIQMVNQQQVQQQQYHHHHHKHHPHALQQWESAPDLYSNLMEPLYITPPAPPVIQVNNQPAPLSTAAAPQIVTQVQKPHRTPSRPNPPTFENGPTYVRASPDLLEHFSSFDTDGSGAISFDELQACLKNREASKSRHFNSEVITVLIEMFDNNNDGMIDTHEFPELIAYLRNWNSCFAFLDEDKSGMLEYEEMHHAVSAMGLTISHSLMKDIMAKYEFTEKNKIDLDNFILSCVTLSRFKETYEFMMETGGTTCKHIALEEFLRTMLLSSGTIQSSNTLPIA